MRAFVWIVSLMTTLVISTASVWGAQPCGPRADLLKQLAVRYSEAPSAIGLANNGALVEVLTSADGSTWTLILSMPNGASCLMAAGESWQAIERTGIEEPDL